MTSCFKGAIHAHNKWIFCKCQDITLDKGLLDLVSEDEILLINFLHGKSLSGFFVSHKINRTEEVQMGEKKKGLSNYYKSILKYWVFYN